MDVHGGCSIATTANSAGRAMRYLQEGREWFGRASNTTALFVVLLEVQTDTLIITRAATLVVLKLLSSLLKQFFLP